MEFVSPILSGDTGLDEVRAFCKSAKELGFEVNGDCGYHLHLDMRDTNISMRKSIAYAYRLTYPIWSSLVNQYRAHDCQYCCAPNYTAADIVQIPGFLGWCECRNRYEFVNLAAYSRHRTFEIRGYQGTLNPVEIINWIDAHLRFVAFVKDKPLTELLVLLTSWKAFKKILGPDLARYYGRKKRPEPEPVRATEVLGGRPAPISWVYGEPRDRDLRGRSLYQSTPTDSFNEFVWHYGPPEVSIGEQLVGRLENFNLTRRER
jgi:hypothetical protein